MAWFDLVGGIAGGLQQGLTQLQQAQRVQKQDQQKAQQDFLEAVQAGRIDPLNVSAEALQTLSPQQIKTLVVKDPTTNALVMRMNEPQLQKIKRTRAAEQQFYGDTFANLPPEQQMLVATQAGVSPTEAYVRMSPEARRTYASLMKPSTPDIGDYQARINSLVTQAKNLQDEREKIAFIKTTDAKRRVAEIDAELGQVRSQLNNLSASVDVRLGVPSAQPSAGMVGGGTVVIAPDGSRHQFDTIDQANRFKQLAGIK